MDTSSRLLLTEREAALRLGLTPRFLQLRRRKGEPPYFVKISARCIRYRVCDIDAFIEDRLRTSTADPGPEGV